MATSRAQRAGIWVIAGALIIGTLFGFVAMILGQKNQAEATKQVQAYQKDYQEYTDAYQARQKSLDKDTKKLSKKYYDQLASYKKYVKKFDKSDVKKLDTETLKSGGGDKIGGVTTYSAYYIGWTPDGKIFDSSFDKSSLKSPLLVDPNSPSGGVISGWSDGVQGKKIGGAYLLTIPADKAYGKEGSGDKIDPNTPLKFVVMPIKKYKTLSPPQLPDNVDLSDYYGQSQQ